MLVVVVDALHFHFRFASRENVSNLRSLFFSGWAPKKKSWPGQSKKITTPCTHTHAQHTHEERRREKKQRTRNTHANSRTQDYKGARDVRHTLRRGQTRKNKKKTNGRKMRENGREREKEKKEKRDCRPNKTLGWLSHTRNTDGTTTRREHARTQLVRLANRRRDGKMKLYLVAPRAKPQLRGQHSKQLEVISSRVFYFFFFFFYFSLLGVV